ncbi:XdhC family protein [Peribacillus sp. B-H-3]|uniref:XdhC family protein n=1 Tax=Peribacillus sp. B-H-3 TaxID=3400420 RepID=UPI003B012C87
MAAILKELRRCRELGIRGVLGTIISTEGSTYQKAGAKCFFSEDGSVTGQLSGGCLEEDIKAHLEKIMDNGISEIMEYDFRDPDDILWGLGSGCQGKMKILLEAFCPENKKEENLMYEYFEAGEKKEMHLITIIHCDDKSRIGLKWLLDPCSKDLPVTLTKEIASDYLIQRRSRKNGISQIMDEWNTRIFFEILEPPPQLVIFGAGPDAIPLSEMAKILNWKVILLDYRPAYADKEKFPGADEIIVYPSGEVPEVGGNKNTFIVVMTHHFLQDQKILEKLMAFNQHYVGVLGPKKRTKKLIMTSEQLRLNFKSREICSPIGLDIGSKSPEEIALSILAEILMVYRGGSGSRLYEMNGRNTGR